MTQKLARLICLSTLPLLLTACAGLTAKTSEVLGVAEKVTSKVKEDAETSLRLVQAYRDLNVLTDAQVETLRACPDIVLKFTALADLLKVDVEGFKGIIYHAEKARILEMQTDVGRALATQLIAACGSLLPVEKLIGL